MPPGKFFGCVRERREKLMGMSRMTPSRVGRRREERGAGDGALVLAAAGDAELWLKGKSQIDDREKGERR
jgi:hypothetical protein